MTYLTLHLRARRTPVAVTAMLVTAAVGWLAWTLASDSPEIGPPLAGVTLALACVALSVTLAGDDEALERTGSRPWPQVRALHLLIAFALLLAVFTAGRLTPVSFGSFAFVTRDVAGLLGLTALGAAALGAHRAWFAPVFLSMVAVIWGGPTDNHGMQVLTWITQPTGTTASTLTALTLAAVGAGAYIRGRAGLPRTDRL